MVQEAFLLQLKVYPLQLEAYLLQFYATECFAKGEDCLLLVQGILYLLQSGWYQKGHRLLDFFFNLNVVCFISLRHGIN